MPVERFAEEALQEAVVRHLCAVNGDFEHAYGDAKPSTRPRLKLYARGTGPFEKASTKLKHEYVWQLDAAAATRHGILDAQDARGAR